MWESFHILNRHLFNFCCDSAILADKRLQNFTLTMVPPLFKVCRRPCQRPITKDFLFCKVDWKYQWHYCLYILFWIYRNTRVLVLNYFSQFFLFLHSQCLLILSDILSKYSLWSKHTFLSLDFTIQHITGFHYFLNKN